MKTPQLILTIGFILPLALDSNAQDFSFSGPNTATNPFPLGALPESTNSFLVQQHSDTPVNSLNPGDNFGFSIAEDAIVTVTLSPGENLEYMGLNVYGPAAGGQTGGQAISSESVNPGDTVVGSEPLLAGNYLITSSGSIPAYDPYPLVFNWTYGGGITVVYLPVMRIGNASVAVSGSETTNANFTVSLSKPCSQIVTAIYTMANGSAIAGQDYQSSSAHVIFQPGETNQTISVPVYGGNLAGPEVDFFVNLSVAMVGGLNVTIANATGTGTILNEDYPPTFQSLTQTNGTIQLSWSIVPGQTYQLQYNTDLSSTNWLNLGGSITAATTNALASDSATNSQCFYRIRLLQN